MTPEGRIKKAVNSIIAHFGNDIYKFMPVPSGYGVSSLDYILCVGGIFVAIETKAPGKKLTPRQGMTCKQIMDAGGVVFVIGDDEVMFVHLSEFLLWVLQKPRSKKEAKEWSNYKPSK